MKNLITGMDVQAAISWLQQQMNLNHWKIEYVEATPPSIQGAICEIRTIRPRNVARLYLAEDFWELSGLEQQARLRHEMFHIVLDPLWEEHEFEMHAVDIDRNDEYRKRFVRVMERAVEHLTRMPLVAAESGS